MTTPLILHPLFSPKNVQPLNTSSLALGVFDGVHQGHQALIEQATSVLTFHPHPDKVLKKRHIMHLTTLTEQRHLISNLITLRFNTEIANLKWDVFLNQIILPHLKPNTLIVGDDYCFGKKKEGTIYNLQEWGKTHQVNITIIPQVHRLNTPLKSTHIRQLLQTKQFDQAITQLGHPYPIFGTVIKGEGRGKTLGFPTANLAYSTEKCIPSNGVYGGYWQHNRTQRPCLIYIGQKPTFSSSLRQVEVHIPNFSGNLYGNHLKIWLTHFIRPEEKFDSANQLIHQIHLDMHKIKNNIDR